MKACLFKALNSQFKPIYILTKNKCQEFFFLYIWLITDTRKASKLFRLCVSIFYIFMKRQFGNWTQSSIFFFSNEPSFHFCATQIDNLFSNQRISFSYGAIHEHKVERRQFLDISWDYIHLTVILCSFHDNCLGEAPNKTNLSCHLFT